MTLEKYDEPTFRRLVTGALAKLHDRMTDLEKRLTVAEEKPEEVLQAIEKIWKADPECGNNRPKEIV